MTRSRAAKAATARSSAWWANSCRSTARPPFTFLDLGAGTGAAARGILNLYPQSTAIIADYSRPMMLAGESEMQPFARRFSYVEFDMSVDLWPRQIPARLDAVVTSMCIHHMPDGRKQGLFGEIHEHLAPGGWYFNYDTVTTTDPVVIVRLDLGQDGCRRNVMHAQLHLVPLICPTRQVWERQKWANCLVGSGSRRSAR